MDHAGPDISRESPCHDLARPAVSPEGGSPAEEAPWLSRPLQVLHLEDSPSDSDLAREHLVAAEIPCVFRRVDTKEHFVAALRDGGFDLILADYQLPAFDGLKAFELARQLRPDVPFLMLTGKLGEEHAIDTLKHGVTDYVLKKSLSSRLAPAVRRALLQAREHVRRCEAESRLARYQQELEELVRLRTAELEERNSQLAAVNRDQESFIATATHDMRSPLAAIGGFAKLLEKSCADKIDPSDLDLLYRIGAAADRMEHLLDELLAFFLASTTSPGMVPIDMEAVTRAAFAELRPLTAERRVQLDLGTLPMALGEPAMIRQVLVNLLANAVKFTGARDLARIEVSGRGEPSAAEYCVRDNGIGFDMRLSERLYELFQRLHDSPEYPGTGIGLATVKRIVEKHGGRVWATSVPGEGSSFCFTLPRPVPSQGV